MNRRGFLGAMLAAPAIVRAESLMRIATPSEFYGAAEFWPIGGGNKLVTLEQVAKEALKMFQDQLAFVEVVNREWQAELDGAVLIRRPQRLVA